jgi:hypothetical protein
MFKYRMSHFFEIDRYYDYSKSSEWNYASPHAPFVGEYVEQRSLLDYSYHTRYSESRQLLQVRWIYVKFSCESFGIQCRKYIEGFNSQ